MHESHAAPLPKVAEHKFTETSWLYTAHPLPIHNEGWECSYAHEFSYRPVAH